MSDRRRNIFVLLAVLGLIVASLAVIVDEADEARPRPPGRRPARLRGAADQAAADGHAGGARPRARHHARPRRLARRRRARAAALRREPDRRQPAGRRRTPSAPSARSARRPRCTSTTGSRTSSTRTARPTRSRSTAASSRSAGSTTRSSGVEVPAGVDDNNTHRRALLRVRQEVARSRSTTAIPEETEGRARGGPRRPGPAPRRPRSSRCPRASSSCAPSTSASPTSRRGEVDQWWVHQGQPGPRRHRHQEPGAELRGRHRRPADRHDGVHRQGPQGVRRDDARDRPARRRQRGAQRRPAGPDRRLAPLRDPARQRADLDAVHQLPREPGRDRRLAGRPDLRRLHDPDRAGPRAAAQDRRAAAPARADLALAGLRDARPAGARPGPRSPASRASRSSRSSCSSSTA